jgi:hypothetical protein
MATGQSSNSPPDRPAEALSLSETLKHTSHWRAYEAARSEDDRLTPGLGLPSVLVSYFYETDPLRPQVIVYRQRRWRKLPPQALAGLINQICRRAVRGSISALLSGMNSI